jgi:hypothetical protein
MMRVEKAPYAVIVAVPPDAVHELVSGGLASPIPVLRGATVQAAVMVGSDAAALVTLLQAPEAVRAFGAWIRDRCKRSGDSIEISATRGNRRLRLTVDGDVDVGVVADFLTAALADRGPCAEE